MNFRAWLESWESFPRQRQLPFMNWPENPWMRKGASFVEEEYESDNLYHVTPALDKIKQTLVLKSRAQLGHQTGGLGGGGQGLAPSKISLTYSFSRARELYDQFQFVAAIVGNRIKASQIWSSVSSLSNDYYYDEETLSHTDEVLIDYGIPKSLVVNGEEQKIAVVLDKKIKTAKAKYEFFQALEKAVLEDNQPEDHSEYVYTTEVVGFTEPFEQMKQLNPKQIAIIQVVVRKNARIEHVSEEMEIRASPKDVAIVKWFQPAVGY